MANPKPRVISKFGRYRDYTHLKRDEFARGVRSTSRINLGLNLLVSDPEPVIVVGAGGHAKVVIELFVARAKYRIVGLVDKGRSGATGGIPSSAQMMICHASDKAE